MNALFSKIAPPLFLLLALTFETQALQRIPAGGGPRHIEEGTAEKPTAEAIWQRIAANSLEQTVVMFGTAIALFATATEAEDTFPNNQKLAVAATYMYIIGRPLFAIGYLMRNAMELDRIYGLFIGGFWLVQAYLLYTTLALIGVSGMFWPCTIGLPILYPILLWILLPGAESGSAGEKEAIATKEPSA